MCLTVVTADGRWLHSVREIEAEPWGVQFTVADLDADDGEDGDLDWRDCCLCGINAQAALDRAGVTYIDDCGFLDVTGHTASG